MPNPEPESPVPLPLEDVLRRTHLPGRAAEPAASLGAVSFQTLLVQDFRPLPQSLEWELAKLYWRQSGVDAFGRSEVPFVINNDGRASDDAAATFYALCREAGAALPRPLVVLELGAGSALFARFFLDAFAAICRQEGADFYESVIYVVTDGSRRTVEQWAERDVFGPHAGHVAFAVADAMRPSEVEWVSVPGAPPAPALDRLSAVFANYVLDVLPTAVVREAPGREAAESATVRRAEQLYVRTSLLDDPSAVAQYTAHKGDEIRKLAEDPAKRPGLLPLLPVLELETRFEPVTRDEIPHLAEALEWGAGLERIPLNYGALTAIDEWLERLVPQGILLVSDYGPVRREEVEAQTALQRFGGSTAHGLNWPLIERHAENRDVRALAAPGDELRAIHTRLLSRRPGRVTTEVFCNRFAKSSDEYRQGPVDRARAAVQAGRREEAVECYKNALATDPRNWHVIGEAAEFVGMVLRDFASGCELARAALERNPWYSPWLWNVLGDCLFCMGRHDDAYEAYQQAARIDPRDPRTQLNLAYAFAQRGQPAEALAAVACGLAHDVQGAYRARLVEKQQQILLSLSARWLAEQERLARRRVRFG
jgi:tetratricopeptide (TPR) repeat protein